MNTQFSFLHLLKKISDCLILVDCEGNILFLNPIAEKMFQISTKDIVGQSINKLILNYNNHNMVGQEEKQLFGLKENQLQFPIQIVSHTLSFEKGLFEVILVEELNGGQTKKEEIANLNRELADIKLALDASTIIAITDHRGVITLVNDKFCELSKYTKEELIGQNHRILNSGFHPKEFFREMWETIASGEIWKGEIRNKAKDGSLYWVDTTIVPFLNDNGKPYKFVSIRTDITKRVGMEKELHEELKDDFIHTIKNLQNGIFKAKKNKDGNIIYTMAEGKLMEQIGTNSAALLNKTPFDVFTNEIATIKQFHYDKAFEGNRVNYEIEIAGTLLYVDVSPVKLGDDVIELVGSVHDISELRSTQRELQENQQYYQSLFEHSQDYVIIYSTQGNVVNMNPKAEDMFGDSNNSILYKDFFEKAIQGNPQNFEVKVENKDKNMIFLNLTYLPIIVDNQITGVYSIGKDITEQKKIQEINAYLAHHDELTGLPNRRWMQQKLHDSIKQAKENKQKLAVLFMDLDRFKYINDTLGHFIGDRLLEQFSSRLLSCFNDYDQLVARMGGDEFMVLIPQIHFSDEPVEMAKKIIESLETPFVIEDYELFMTTSIGISSYPDDGDNVVDLMKNADIALYRAKEQGQNTFQNYLKTMYKKSAESFILERDLRKAVLNNEFIVHLQPRVDTTTGELLSAEALIRWKHPELGTVSPGEFIPLAEETGLIIPLGQWMKRSVCEQLVAWRAAGIPLIPISVNISSKRFLKKDFAQEVSQLLETYGLDGKWLEIEITENSLMKNEEYITHTLQELKALGVKIYIDDFGTGYSSFNYLKTFKIDGIKIDRSFIRNISYESENAGITIAMIKMAHHLKMEVVAEGVETEEELEFLRKQKCNQVQGFLFSKPCSIEEFEQNFLVKEKRNFL